MRTLVLPFAVWLGVLQLPPNNQSFDSLATTGALLSAAVALSGLTMMVYRLGVWRQEMNNTKNNVGAEVARFREESTREFARIDQRFASLEVRLDKLTP